MISHTVAVVNPLKFIGWIYWARVGHCGLRYNQDYLQSFLWDLILNATKWPIENVHQCVCDYLLNYGRLDRQRTLINDLDVAYQNVLNKFDLV